MSDEGILLSFAVLDAVYSGGNGGFVRGFVCCKHKSVISIVMSRYPSEMVNLKEKKFYSEDPQAGKCYFVPIAIQNDVNNEMLELSMVDESLLICAHHVDRFASLCKSDTALSSIKKGKKTQTTVTPASSAEIPYSKESLSKEFSIESEHSVCDSVASKSFKTPKNAVAQSETNVISAKDKKASSVHFNITDDSSKEKEWKAPIPSNEVIDPVGMTKSVVLDSFSELKRSCKWTCYQHGEKPHLMASENQVYAIPFGRYSSNPDNRGFENLEFFTEQKHFVAHIQRNPIVTYGFKEVWSGLESQGWYKDSSTESCAMRLLFNVEDNLPKLEIPSYHRSGSSILLGIHEFKSQAALHLYVMRFPYPLQHDTVLADTLESMGWTKSRCKVPRYYHPLFKRGSPGATLSEVRRILWADPTLLVAEPYKFEMNNLLAFRDELRSAFAVPDEVNVSDPDESHDIDDKYVRDILSIVKGHIGKKTECEHKNGSGGLWWKFTKEEIKKLEDLLVKRCGWEIGVPDVDNWWRHMKAYFPNFHEIASPGSPLRSKGSKKRKDKYIPGVTIFWSLDDAVNYIRLYGNVPPVDLSLVNKNLRVDYTTHDSHSHYKSIVSDYFFNLEKDFISVFKTLLDDGWSLVKVKPFRLKTLYPTCKKDCIVESVLVASWVDGKASNGLLNISLLQKDKDFFVFKECVVEYLKVFGAERVSQGQYNKKTNNGNSITNGKVDVFHVLSMDKKCVVYLCYAGDSHESRIRNEINDLIFNQADARNVKGDVVRLLQDIGWIKHFSSSNFKHFFSETVIFPPWVGIPASSEGLTLNIDFFLQHDDVFNFVKANGFDRPSESARKAEASRPRAAVAEVKKEDSQGKCTPPAKRKGVIITRKSSGEDESDEASADNDKDLLDVLNSPSGRYKADRILEILLGMGWKKNVKSNFSIFSSDYIILPYWSVKYFDFKSEGKDSSIEMVDMVHYFTNKKDVVAYLRKYGNKESSAALEEAKSSRRRRSAKPEDDKDSKKSDSNLDAQDSKKHNKKPKERSKPEKQLEVEVVEYKESKKNEKKSKEKSHVDEKEDTNAVDDPFPGLSDTGDEGLLKQELIENPEHYSSKLIIPYMKSWGWQFHVKSDPSLYFQDTIILAPWAAPNYAFDECGKNSIFALHEGADYFREFSDARDYILTHGNREMSLDAKESLVSSNARLSRRKSTVKKTHASAAPSSSVRGKESESSKRSNSCVSKKDTRTSKRARRVKDSNQSEATVADDDTSSSDDNDEDINEDDEEEAFTYTQALEQFQLPTEKSVTEKPPLDADCSSEIREIVRASCKDRPRLNPSDFVSVFNVLRGYGWNYLYTNKLGITEIYHRPRIGIKPSNWHEYREDIDYFKSKDAVLKFVKDQIVARDCDYQMIADNAMFRTNEDMNNDDELLIDAVHDEDHINLKLPTTSLHQSSNPYETTFDALATQEYEDDISDDIPYGMLTGGEDSFVSDDEEIEGPPLKSDTSRESITHTSNVATEKTQPQIVIVSPPVKTDETPNTSEDYKTQSKKRKASPLFGQSTNDKNDVNKKASPKKKSISIVPGSSFSKSSPKTASIRGSQDAPALTRSAKVSSPKGSPQEPLRAVLSRVKSRLQGSYSPPNVLHREKECKQLSTALNQFLDGQSVKAIRVAGQPGQGKTLAVKHVLSTLPRENILEIFLKGNDSSTMGFRNLAKRLSIGSFSSEDQAHSAVRNRIQSQNGPSKIIIVIDEIDMAPVSFIGPLFSVIKSLSSQAAVIGLANNSALKDYDVEVVFEVYKEKQLLDILTSLTENIIDERAAIMIAKTATAEGDVRPMTTLALSCLEHVEQSISNSELSAPARSVVSVVVVSKVKSQLRALDTKEKLGSLTKNAIISLVAIVLQYKTGDVFNFEDAFTLINTHAASLELVRCNGDEAVKRLEELIEAGFLISSKSPKAKNSPNKENFTLGVGVEDLLQENCKEILKLQNWNAMENVAMLRKQGDGSTFTI